MQRLTVGLGQPGDHRRHTGAQLARKIVVGQRARCRKRLGQLGRRPLCPVVIGAVETLVFYRFINVNLISPTSHDNQPL